MGTETLQESREDSIKEQEVKLYQILLSKWVDKKYPNFIVKNIQEGIFAIWNEKRVYSYCTEKWEPIFNIGTIRGFQFVDTWEAILGSWYFEKKEWDIYKLYSVLWLDKNDKPVLEKTPIDPYSKEYYEAWVKIDFNATLLGKTLLKQNPTSLFSKEELIWIGKNILEDLDTWAILIEDLETFLEQKKITKDFFDIAVKKVVQDKLLFQCSDVRLDKVGQWITEEKLKKYFEKWYINEGIAKNCLLAIRAKTGKKKEKGAIGDETEKGIERIGK